MNKESLKSILILALAIITIFLLFNNNTSKPKWSIFYYPNGCLDCVEDWDIEINKFKSEDTCKEVGINKQSNSKTKGDIFECGYKCKEYDDSGYICEKTIDYDAYSSTIDVPSQDIQPVEEEVTTNTVREAMSGIGLNLSQLSYALPEYSMICIPEEQSFCSESGCKNITPSVFLLYDEAYSLMYRCDSKPCDIYPVNETISGSFRRIESTDTNKGWYVVIDNENNYRENTSFLLDTYINQGSCFNK